MYKDIECPYCGKEQDIDHDDGYGYDENETYEQECECGKTFVYNTSIMFHYAVYKAPCKNGGNHKWKQIIGAPRAYFVGCDRCEYCGEERIDKEKNDIAMAKYFKELDKKISEKK